MTVLLVTRGHKWNSIESGKLELERGFPPSKALTENCHLMIVMQVSPRIYLHESTDLKWIKH